jgi:hypothetical protein
MSSPTPPALQRLHRLNRSLSGFHDQLSNALYGREYRQCVPNLQGDDLAWLVDYLDKVCCRIALPHSPHIPAQALDGLDSSGPAFRKCLRELRSICGTRAILPTLYTLSSHLLNIGPDPVAAGGYGDIYEGTLGGSKVCVKRVRVYTSEDPKKATKVCYRNALAFPVRHH